MSLSSHQSTRMKSDTWLTPPRLLAQLGEFDLDPCTPPEMPWPTAKRRYTQADDGLSQPWTGRVWLNPPFGSEAIKWMRKMAAHGDGIALLHARTETRMFFETVWGRADAVCFLPGRPRFHHADGTPAPFNCGAPICLIAYGEDNADVLDLAVPGFTVRCK